VERAALVEGTGGPETIAALSTGLVPAGMAMSIIDGRFLAERPEAALAAGRQAKVPVMIGATDRDLAIGTAHSKEELFANFGPNAAEASRLYDPNGDQTLDELEQQVFADRTLVEPARHFAKEMVRAGQPVWLYRFADVSGAKQGFEIPFTLNVPAAVAAGKAMGDMASAYWVQFAKTGDPNGSGRPAWPRYDPKVDRLVMFTNSGVTVGADPLKARLDLWERVSSQAR